MAWQGLLESNSNNNRGLVHRAQINNQQSEYACGRNGVLRGFCRQERARKKKPSADFSFFDGPDRRMGRQEQLCQQCKQQHKHSTYNTVGLELESLMWTL